MGRFFSRGKVCSPANSPNAIERRTLSVLEVTKTLGSVVDFTKAGWWIFRRPKRR